MASSMRKTTLREIKGTFGRFFAIMAIIALGVGFFSGVRITTPAMVSMMNSYIRNGQLYDYRLISTLGWDEENVDDFAEQNNVRYAEGSKSIDALFIRGDKEEPLKVYSLPENVNGYTLTEGRLPQSPDECVVDENISTKLMIGDDLLLSDENEEKTVSTFKHKKFRVVGKARSVSYINFERGTTSLGNGSLAGFIYVLPEEFDTDVFTEIYIKTNTDYMIYSDEYDDYIDSLSDSMEKITKEQAELRYQRIYDDAQAELLDGRSELNDKRADGQKELDDAKAELASAEKDLSEAEKKLSDSKKDIENGQKELDKSKKQLDDGQTELNKAKQQLDASKKQLEDSEKKLISGEEQLRDGQAQIDAAYAELDAQSASVDAQENELRSSIAMIDFLPAEQQMQINAAQEQINSGRSQIDAARQELDAKQAELDAKRAELESGRAEYESGKAQYEAGLKEYEKSAADLAAGKAKYDQGVKEFEKGKADYENGLKEYQDGQKEYKNGLADYNDGQKEFKEKIADAEKELADAENEISDLKKPDTYVLTRSTNIGYACFESDSEIVSQVARVFPVFFILVAALVCMTTMSRMVEEQRTQIGIFKALGYSNHAIMRKFIFYSGSAAALGCIIGYTAGTILFPRIIWMTYKLMYTPLDLPYLFDWKLAAVAGAVSMLCSIGTTYISCRYELNETAASLMRPKAPKAGKRVFLEYIPFIWQKLKFLYKVSIRNIFRYKGRFFMMILGIGGCMALLVTGFGIKDSIAGFADLQYGEIQTTDALVNFRADKNGDIPQKLIDNLDSNTQEYTFLRSGAWDIIYGNKVKSITLEAVGDLSAISRFINFRAMDGTPLAAPGENEALISHSVAERYGAKKGSQITLRDEKMRELNLTVAGVFENHVYNYVFISADTLEKQLGEKTEFNEAFVNFPAGSDISTSGANIAKNSSVTSVVLYDELKTRLGNMMSSLDYIVLLIIVCAAGLAFIVIYNLTNINITERIREIATIKVLGFFRRETSAYVLRENIALTAIGILVGTGLGILLHRFVMQQIVVDMVDFTPRIIPMSFVYSILLTFGFNFIVDLFMEFKLEKINMAESLKSVE